MRILSCIISIMSNNKIHNFLKPKKKSTQKLFCMLKTDFVCCFGFLFFFFFTSPGLFHSLLPKETRIQYIEAMTTSLNHKIHSAALLGLTT